MNESISTSSSLLMLFDVWSVLLDLLASPFVIGVVVGAFATGLGLFAFSTVKNGRGRASSRDRRKSEDSQPQRSTSERGADRPPPIRPFVPNPKDKERDAKIAELEKENVALRKELDKSKSVTPQPEVSTGYGVIPLDYQQPPVDDLPIPRAARSSSKSIYFPAPTPDGLFDSRYSSATKIEGESLYVLRLVSESEAEVHLDNSKISVNKAKNSPEQILDPVCEGTRSPMNQILGIRMTAPGKARLEGDDWRVYEKVKLTYEY